MHTGFLLYIPGSVNFFPLTILFRYAIQFQRCVSSLKASHLMVEGKNLCMLYSNAFIFHTVITNAYLFTLEYMDIILKQECWCEHQLQRQNNQPHTYCWQFHDGRWQIGDRKSLFELDCPSQGKAEDQGLPRERTHGSQFLWKT